MTTIISFGKEYRGVMIGVQNSRSIEDFDRYSGTNSTDALDFLKEVIDKTGFSGRATIFYSGYSGFLLEDKECEKVGYIMYDGNRYGLEDASRGRGWYFSRTHNHTLADIDVITSISDAVSNLSQQERYKTLPVRM